MDKVNLRAYGKINLGLDVIGTLPNGYHEVRMIMQTVNLYDRLEITRISTPSIIVRTNLHFLPVNENNLVYAAADMFRKKFNITDGVYITLEKHIPVSAGMAGGSSDAAATLRGMNRLFKTNLSDVELREMGVLLGADVPYCIMGGTVLSEGIGELLTPIHRAPDCHCLIVKPPVNISTQYVYKNLVLDEKTVHPDIDSLRSAIEADDLYEMCSHFGNVLETVSVPMHPVINEIKGEMMRLGAINSMMSGSGPTVFGIFDDIYVAKRAFYSIKVGRFGKHTYLTDFYQKNCSDK